MNGRQLDRAGWLIAAGGLVQPLVVLAAAGERAAAAVAPGVAGISLVCAGLAVRIVAAVATGKIADSFEVEAPAGTRFSSVAGRRGRHFGTIERPAGVTRVGRIGWATSSQARSAAVEHAAAQIPWRTPAMDAAGLKSVGGWLDAMRTTRW